MRPAHASHAETKHAAPARVRRRTRRVRDVATLAVVAVIAVLVAGCSDSSAPSGSGAGGPSGSSLTAGDQGPRPGGKLVYGVESEPNGLDPTRNGWDVSAQVVANAIYDPLVSYDREGRTQPYLLDRIDADADHTHWTLTLRSGVRFHDGAALDADALLQWGAALRASAITGPAAVLVTDVRKTGPLAVEVTTSRPWATFPSLLTGQSGMVISPNQVTDPQGSVRPVGTGPFRLRDWKVGDRIVLARNADYWRAGLPYLDSVELVIVADRNQRLERLERGELDVAHLNGFLTATERDSIDAHGDLVVQRDTRTIEPAFIALNTAEGPTSDRDLRRALALATDKRALAAVAGWPEEQLIVDRVLSPENPFSAPITTPSPDPTEAARLVAAYEREHGPARLTLVTVNGPPGLALAQAIAAQWGTAGVDVDVEAVDEKAMVIRAVAGTYDAITFRYFGTFDPDGNYPFFSGLTVRPVGQISLNFTRFTDAEVDAAIERSQATTDVQQRRAAYADLYQRLTDEGAFIWLYRSEWMTVAHSRVRQLGNRELPDGTPALERGGGTHRLTETWLAEG